MTTRFVFTDPYDASTYTFAVNPTEGVLPGIKRRITSTPTTASGGVMVRYEGRNELQPYTWNGYVLDAAGLAALDTWYSKKHQIQLTDCSGTNYMVYLTSYTAKRTGTRQHPAKCDVTVTALIVDVVS